MVWLCRGRLYREPIAKTINDPLTRARSGGGISRGLGAGPQQTPYTAATGSCRSSPTRPLSGLLTAGSSKRELVASPAADDRVPERGVARDRRVVSRARVDLA